MNITIINKEEFVDSDYLFQKAPIYCKLYRTARELVRKKKITDFVFAKLVDKKWVISDGKSYKFDKVFFKKLFVKSIPEINQEKVITDDNNIELAPDIIHLENNEKFKDDQDKIVEIETRGDRKVDSIYFKVKDVMSGFAMTSLDNTIIDKKRHGYIEGVHYKYFNCLKKVNDGKKFDKIKKELYLTYEGMLRVLFASHSPNVKPFIKWATEILFTFQLGLKEDKKILVNKLLGCDIDQSRKILNCNSSKISSIYLITLGIVKDLRDTFNIPELFNDDYVVVKYGRSDDLQRRLQEHQTKYNKLNNVNVMLKLYSYVDDELAPQAENDIKMIFQLSNNILKHTNYNELAIINPIDFDKIKKAYDIIKNNYSGNAKEYIHKINMIEKDCEIKLLQKDNIILQKDNEILHLKLQLATKQI